MDNPRITPAGAGKSVNWFIAMRKMGGSPPQVRGKVSIPVLDFFLQRITPAGAGKSRALAANPDAQEDHPRRCGEKQTVKPYK